MDPRSVIRTVIAALVGVGIIVLFIVLMFRIFARHPATSGVTNLGSYSNGNATATLLIDAPTNVNQEHRQVKITVSNTLNEIDIISGYQNDVVQSQTYASNSSAFAAFLQALKQAGFTKGNTKSTVDYRGYCPLGDRYVYTFNDGNRDLFNFWTTSCGQGTFGGNRALVRSLFERQIPQADFGKMTTGIPLG